MKTHKYADLNIKGVSSFIKLTKEVKRFNMLNDYAINRRYGYFKDGCYIGSKEHLSNLYADYLQMKVEKGIKISDIIRNRRSLLLLLLEGGTE